MDLNMQVLVVDDFVQMRRILRDVLKQIGFRNIADAEDGLAAIRVLKKQKIELILADWNMPNMTGLELLKAVRNDESLKSIPFVMVTAEAQESAVLEAVQAGATNYIVKPFTASTVEEKLKDIFDRPAPRKPRPEGRGRGEL
ncbi:MAG: response regulator [Desulfobacterales bacterium]|nr:response regulator [Desulfobacterales bacterium]